MKVGRIVLVGVLGLLLFGFLIGGCTFYSSYKTVISLDESVKESWSNVDADLQRRYDLIPNIVETVKGYAKHEKDLLETIANARKAYFTAATPNEKAQAAGGFAEVMSRLLVLQERYPDLKANQNFLTLMDQLEGTENRITEKRRRYNESVRQLNTHIRGPIGSITSKWANVTRAEPFATEEGARKNPQVDFTTG